MAIDTGELDADTDPRQVAFDMLGIVLVFYRSGLLLGDAEAGARARAGFDRLITQHTPRK
jgi:hypothetical protein